MNSGYQPSRIPKNSKREANKRLIQIEKDVAGYIGRCLFVVDDSGRFCNEPVNNDCHMISESAVLSKLRDKDSKVVNLEWGVSQWRQLTFRSDVDSTTVPLPRRPTGDACVGRFACKPYGHAGHDDEFQPIDVEEPDFSDPGVRLLVGYRMEMFLADQCRLSMNVRRKWNSVAMRNSPPRSRAYWCVQMEKVKTALEKAESAVTLLGKHWHARETTETLDPGLVSAQVLRFRSNLKIAGSVFYGRYTALTVFPTQEDWHKMGVLYLTSESDEAGEDIGRLVEVAGASEKSNDYGATVTKELITNGWGTLAASPMSYKELNDQDRLTIQRLIAEQTGEVELVRTMDRQSYARERWWK